MDFRNAEYTATCMVFENEANKVDNMGANFDDDAMNVAGHFYGKLGNYHTFDYDGSNLIVDGKYRGHFEKDAGAAFKALKRSMAHSN